MPRSAKKILSRLHNSDDPGVGDFGVATGMVIAACILVRTFDQTVYAREVLGAAGIKTKAALYALDLDDYDLEPLLPLVQ